jgi:hypothetical protein
MSDEPVSSSVVSIASSKILTSLVESEPLEAGWLFCYRLQRSLQGFSRTQSRKTPKLPAVLTRTQDLPHLYDFCREEATKRGSAIGISVRKVSPNMAAFKTGELFLVRYTIFAGEESRDKGRTFFHVCSSHVEVAVIRRALETATRPRGWGWDLQPKRWLYVQHPVAVPACPEHGETPAPGFRERGVLCGKCGQVTIFRLMERVLSVVRE